MRYFNGKIVVYLLLSLIFIVLFSSFPLLSKMFQYQLQPVTANIGGSSVKSGSAIIMRQIDPYEIFTKGEIITYYKSNSLLLTEIVKVIVMPDGSAAFLTSENDNRGATHELVLASNVVAKYTGTTIPYIGYLLEFTRSLNGKLLLFDILLLLFLIHILKKFKKIT